MQKFKFIALDTHGVVRGAHYEDCASQSSANSRCCYLNNLIENKNNNLKFKAHVES